MLRALIARFRPTKAQVPDLGTLVLKGACWDGVIPFPNSEGSAVIMIQAGDPPVAVQECHRQLILDVRRRASELHTRMAASLNPPDHGTWEIVVIDVQGSTCDAPELELTLERTEDGEVRSVAVRGNLDAPLMTILSTEPTPRW